MKNNSLRKQCKKMRKIHHKIQCETKLLESRLCISNQTLEATNNTQLKKIQELESHIINLINTNSEDDITITNIMNTSNIELYDKIKNLEEQVESRLCISNQTLEATTNTLLKKLQELESHIINLINASSEASITITNITNIMNTLETTNIELYYKIKNLEKQVESKFCCIM